MFILVFLSHVGIYFLIFNWLHQMWFFQWDMVKKMSLCKWLKGFAQIHILSTPFLPKANLHFSGKYKLKKKNQHRAEAKRAWSTDPAQIQPARTGLRRLNLQVRLGCQRDTGHRDTSRWRQDDATRRHPNSGVTPVSDYSRYAST